MRAEQQHTQPRKRGAAINEEGGEERPRSHIESITIRGFKSLKEIIDLKFSPLNVLVGANGAGKSNFLAFFEMLGWMIRGKNLQEYVARKGGGNDLLFNGAKRTRAIEAKLVFGGPRGRNDYQFTLRHAEDDKLVFAQEEYRYCFDDYEGEPPWNDLGIGHSEAKITAPENEVGAQVIRKILSRCTAYHLHDTSPESPLKRVWDADENVFLRNDGANLAPVLLDLRENHRRIYDEIERIIREVFPVFSGFDLHVRYGRVTLRWHHEAKGKSFGPHLTSDGTLRLMALVTLLNMPLERVSDVLLLDEPELGLHPYAISMLGALIRRLSADKQIVVATQSPLLLNDFSPEDVIVAEMDQGGATSFKRLETKALVQWLDEFRLGELWEKNVIGGNP